MKTDLTKPTTFFILGIPRSGTTIVANLFNSIEDGFCLGEPHWLCEREGPAAVARGCGKVAPEWKQWTDETWESQYIFKAFIEVVLSGKFTPYKLGGYKETYRPYTPLSEELIEHRHAVDFFIIVLRDPIMVMSSMKAVGDDIWTVKMLNQAYQRMDELGQDEKAIVVVYENFCQWPMAYLNARLPFTINGLLELYATGHAYGDPKANRSLTIEVSEREPSISDEWIEELKPAREVWERWR